MTGFNPATATTMKPTTESTVTEAASEFGEEYEEVTSPRSKSGQELPHNGKTTATEDNDESGDRDDKSTQRTIIDILNHRNPKHILDQLAPPAENIIEALSPSADNVLEILAPESNSIIDALSKRFDTSNVVSALSNRIPISVKWK